MKIIKPLNYIFVKSKVWSSIVILAFLFFILLTSTTIQIIHTVTKEVSGIQNNKLNFITELAQTETLQSLLELEATLHTMQSIINDHKAEDFSALLTNLGNNIGTMECFMAFNELGEAIYQPAHLSAGNISDTEFFRYHKSEPNTALQYISEPFTDVKTDNKAFTLSLSVLSNKGEFQGVYLAHITPDFFRNIENHLDISNLTLVVKSSRSHTNYYGREPKNAVIKSEFPVAQTPFIFVLYDEAKNIDIFTYIHNLITNMEILLLIWAGFAILLITLALTLLKRQFKISQTYKDLSNYDPLTGIYNRRAFMELLTQEYIRALRYKKHLSVIMIDIDHFKSINDQYGHNSGDQVLKQFAHLLNNSIRDTDVLARLGGEEFAIFLPETDIKGAIVAANNYCKIISQYAFSTDGFVGMCTASFGVSAFSELSQTSYAENKQDNIPLTTTSFSESTLLQHIDQVLTLADKQLYDAKVTRNCAKPQIKTFKS